VNDQLIRESWAQHHQHKQLSLRKLCHIWFNMTETLHWFQQRSVCPSTKHNISWQVMEELNPHSAKACHVLHTQPPHWLQKYSHPRQSSRDWGLYAAQSGRKIKIPRAFLFLANLITFYSWCRKAWRGFSQKLGPLCTKYCYSHVGKDSP